MVDKNRVQLDAEDAYNLLRKYSIKLPRGLLLKSKSDISKCNKIGFPATMKISSRQVIHKSDVGGVVVGVENEAQAKEAYNQIIRNVKKKMPKAEIDGVLAQKMFSGIETIIGMKRDPQFGPVILFGLGGIFVEIMKDVSMQIAPVNKKQAEEMIHRLKSIALLKGARGNKPADISRIADLIVKVSVLSMKEDLQEIDFNPVMVDGNKINVVDVRIIK